MGNQPFSVCERQNQQHKENTTIQKQIQVSKIQKLSLQNYRQSINNNKSLNLKSQINNQNKQFIKPSPQIQRICQLLTKKQAMKHQYLIKNKEAQILNQQKLTNPQINKNQDLRMQINNCNKIYLQRKGNYFYQNQDRNQKHLTIHKNQEETYGSFDSEYKQFLKNLDIFDQQYFILRKFNDNQILNGTFELYSVKTDINQKYIKIQFQNGFLKSKNAIIITNRGNYYQGGFYNNQFNEKGVLHFYNGIQMRGIFKNGYLQGKGQKIEKDGGHFRGTFKKGKKQGKGQMIWKQNINQNISDLTFSQKKIQLKKITFEGFFKDDKINGLGHLITPNYQYWGPFVDNMKQGKGTMVFFVQNTKFEGWFQKDQIQGYGVKFFVDGTIEKGYFGKTNFN